MLRIIFCCLTMFGARALNSMQQSEQLHALEVIKTSLYLTVGEYSGGMLHYVGDYVGSSQQKDMKNVRNAYNMPLRPACYDVWLPVKHGLEREQEYLRSQLPKHLPLSLFRGKKVGDCVALIMTFNNYHIQNRLFEMRFVCEKGFEKLQQIVRDFAERPNFVVNDEEALLQAGVIVPNPAAEEGNLLIPKYIHGPRGFFSMLAWEGLAQEEPAVEQQSDEDEEEGTDEQKDQYE